MAAEGHSLQLAAFGSQDFDWLISQLATPQELFQWSGNRFQFPLSREQLEQHCSYASHSKLPRSYLYKGVDSRSRQTRAYGEIAGINRRDNSTFLARILVDKAHRRKGLALELVRGLVDIAFQKLKLHRVELKVFAFNQAARSCYLKVGFTDEGLLRDSCFDGKRYHSEHRMGLLSGEW